MVVATELAESSAGDEVMMCIAGPVYRAIPCHVVLITK
jgi:hypothetical protein